MNENKDYVSHLNKARKKEKPEMGSPLPAFSHCRCTAHWSWSISGGKCKVGGFRQGSEKK